MKGLLQIGELARLGGVSVKALRFYDDQGLLRPEHVDPHTGYRYYTIEQATRLALITNLRLVDFSIADIAALLSSTAAPDEAVKSAIKKKQTELRRDSEAIVNRIKIADILMQAEDNAESTLSLKFAPLEPQSVYSVKKRVPHLGKPVTEIFEAAESHVGDRGVRAPAAPFLMFHDSPDKVEDILLEVCIPVTDEAADDLPLTKAPGATLACGCVYGGGYAKTEVLFQRIIEWMRNAGLAPAGPLREIYHRFGADQEDYRLPAKMTAKNNRDYLTELKLPIQF
ncbi:MerR family transcriptional regulator [Hyphococcus flavus]|uniref:MerR family transcriptional regulator n=1 Tax=Hyphococcus flavus TaxID=1866326 RepID=A0AAE9ZC74_9PROT|nr:MerR family transcriptional regulator [Hyphococcus flavus]WDI30770.1 MerR family transcriptional regulator [Hyphococcus flavus]